MNIVPTRMAVALGVAAAASAGLIAVLQAQSPTPRAPQGFISGTVESGKGREAGVWVIAETNELPTQVHEDRRDGRRWPLRAAGAAERHVQRLGARLWPRRLRSRCPASPARR